MNRLLAPLGIGLIAGLTLVSGLVYGRMSNRWGLPTDLLAVGNRLQEIPESFGDWDLESSEALSEAEISMLECAGYIVRTYVNRSTGERVNMSLIVGPAMPISLHTAEICWDSRGHTIRDEREQVALPDSQGTEQEFWALTFEASTVSRDLVRVYYAWSDGNRWSHENERRLSLTRRPYLYKIEVVSHLTPGTDLQQGDPCQRFLQQFVPEAGRHLVPAHAE